MPETPVSYRPPVASTPELSAAEPSEPRASVQRRLTRRSRRLLANFSPLGWYVADLSIALFATMVGFTFTPYDVSAEADWIPLIFAAMFGVVVSTAAHIAGMHDPLFRRGVLSAAGKIATIVVVAISITLLILNFAVFVRIGRYVVIYIVLSSIAGMTIIRYLAWRYARTYAQIICFLGEDDFCYRAAQVVAEHTNRFNIVTPPESVMEGTMPLQDWALDHEVDKVVFNAVDNQVDPKELLGCLDEGINVSSFSDFVEDNYFMVPVEQIGADWLFSARVDLEHPYYHGLKRIVDVVVAIVGLILSAPIILLAVILIKLESQGAAFYSQVRAGRFNRPFVIYKLRSMVTDAEKDGAKWASTSDSRITRIGKVLRRTRIDELPQLWNVLKGEMSLVGPRPERPEFVETLSEQIPFYAQRHLVKPGLTGWAQINYPYGASVEDALNKLKYDLYYAKRASIGLDLQILLRTIGAMMKGSR